VAVRTGFRTPWSLASALEQVQQRLNQDHGTLPTAASESAQTLLHRQISSLVLGPVLCVAREVDKGLTAGEALT